MNFLDDYFKVYDCVDCGLATDKIGEYYRVCDEVWVAARGPEGRSLCVGCLEKRISRRLCKDDFRDVLIHKRTRTSARLQDRFA